MRLSIFPAEWLQAPLDHFETEDPTSEKRHPKPLPGGWDAVLERVSQAIQAAAAASTSALDEIEVDFHLDDFNSDQRAAALSWFGRGDNPPFVNVSQADGLELISGRHRTLAARELGAPAFVREAAISDAIRAVGRDTSIYGEFDLKLLTEARDWWATPDAQPWRELNPRHAHALNEVHTYWTRGLS